MVTQRFTLHRRHVVPAIIHPVEKDVISEESTLLITAPSSDARSNLLVPLRIGRFAYTSEFRLERQRFDSFLLGVVTEGTLHATIWDDGEALRYDVHPGDVFLFDTYRRHEGSTSAITRTSMIHFDGISARMYYECIVAAAGNVFPLGNISYMENAVDMLMDAYTQNSPQSDIIGARILTDLLTDLALLPTFHGNDDLLAVRESVRFIDGHFAERITVSALAQRAMMSERQYLRKFRTVTGATPYAYLVARRIDEAKRLLLSSFMPVQEVAHAVGYPNANAFASAFRSRTGVTPIDFRGNAKSGLALDRRGGSAC
ncbi:AraC family transcriptional regulator [Bifidobacterium felsineum]|uniref:HTH araC/xylS-type domain-containing protein n=1 Tax=Bifidobacterium felsineum TaxID=2045440 RepID=A0A2M9HK22_9BIFI|nr:AraC family transcriptional regulator [Bifidobacterium felsineum]PJM77164.1 hypothetical protein CSQ86_04495 [Bifidobacterium felsineum]